MSSCIQWRYDLGARLCRLWPVSSADNPLNQVQELVFQQKIPQGFVVSIDPKIAYAQYRNIGFPGGNESLAALCQKDHPDAIPAFPSTERQITYIQQNIIGRYLYVGIYRGSDGAFRDMTTDTIMEIPAAWFWNSIEDTDVTNDCLTLYNKGFWAVPCTDAREGYICQYNVVGQTLPPQGYVISDNTTIAYRRHTYDPVSGRESFVQLCKEHDPNAFPAFPSTESQIRYIKENVIGNYFYVGIYRTSDGIFRDMTTDTDVALQSNWFWDRILDGDVARDCLTLYSAGFWAVPCEYIREGYICQYNL